MARIKGNEAIIKNLDEVDAILKELGEIEARLESIDNEANQEITKIKEQAALAGKEPRERYKKLVKTVEYFARYFRADLFNERKSLDRPFGVFGFRKAPDAISVSKDTAGLLQALGLKKFIRTKIEPDKEAMLSLSDETLEQVKASRRSKEDFFIEPKREKVNQKMAKQSA